MSDLMDDPTWCCDYKSRCDNKVIKLFLKDYEKVRKELEGVLIPYNIILKIDDLKKKWDKIYKENEENDK